MSKPHADALKRQAHQAYETRGAAAAAEVCGISVRTIRHWARTEGWTRQLAVAVAENGAKKDERSQAAMIGWSTRRRHLADQLGHVGVQLLEAIQRELAQGQRLNLRDAGILLGIMIDKAEALSALTGGSPDQLDLSPAANQARMERINQLLAVVSQRAREAGDG